MNILDQLADYARLRVRNAKEILPPDQIKYLADTFPQGNFAFENALKKPDIAFISGVSLSADCERVRRRRRRLYLGPHRTEMVSGERRLSERNRRLRIHSLSEKGLYRG